MLSRRKQIRVSGINSGLIFGQPAPHTLAEYLSVEGLLSSLGNSNVTDELVIDYPGAAKNWASPKSQSLQRHLIRFEPEVVLPANYSKLRNADFRTIITVGGDPQKYSVTVPWPQEIPSELVHLEGIDSSRFEKAVLVNGNKMSFVRGEFYSLRRRAVLDIKGLDLYGTSWDSNRLLRSKLLVKALAQALLSGRLPRLSGIRGWFKSYPQWKGSIGSGYSPSRPETKLAKMAEYKYALVIENSKDYMSEKLFDAFVAGCIPIYVGPRIENYGIPGDLVIQSEPNLIAICQGLERAKEINFLEFHKNLRAFLTSQETISKWSRKSVYKMILEALND
jgi:hypothetical protein